MAMDLTYPPEAEEFRKEIRTWLEDNLPEGWFDEGFEMSRGGAPAVQRGVAEKLFDGGWICASWPKEYGGKGLDVMQSVVLNEEFARAGAPLRADFFGDTLVGPTILQWGTEEQKKEFLPKILSGEISWCQGFSEPDARLRPRRPQDERGARRRRVGDQRPEDLDDAGPVRRLRLPARPHRPARAEARGHLLPARADEAKTGIEVRPIAQPDGSAEFNEVFFTNARCPKENVVGGVNNGWDVAKTTLGFERGIVGHHGLPAVRGGARASSSTRPARTAASTTRPCASGS